MKEKKKKNFEKICITIFLTYVFVLCFSGLIVLKYNSGPDEKMKFVLCQYIFEHNTLPIGDEEEIRDPTWGISYAFTPYFSYIISVGFMKIASIFTNNFDILFRATRLVSVIFITAFAFMCTKIGKKLFKGTYIYFFIGFVCFLPQLLYIGSYLNNDSMSLFSTAIIVYSWIIGLENNWDKKSCIILALGLGTCALAYYFAYGYIICSILIFCISCWLKKIDFKEFLKKGFLIAGIALLIAGWWFIRNAIIYNGDIFGFNISREYGEKYAMENFKPSKRWTPLNCGLSLHYMFFETDWVSKTIQSFFAVFGYMNVYMSKGAYITFEIAISIGLISALIGFIIKSIINNIKHHILNEEEKNKKKEKVLFNIIMIIAILIPIGLSIYYSYNCDFQSQGRYIISIVIPLMYFFTTGIQTLFNAIIKNEKIKNVILWIIITIWSLLPIYIFFMYINNTSLF